MEVFNDFIVEISFTAEFISAGLRNKLRIKVKTSAMNEEETYLSAFLNFLGNVTIITSTIVPYKTPRQLGWKPSDI